MLLDFFNGDPMDAVCLTGLEYVISISLGPTPTGLNLSIDEPSPNEELPPIHIRAYTIRFLASGSRTPRTELTPMGPSLDLSLRRTQAADPDLMKQAMKQPKLKKEDIESGLGKKRKNVEIDEMGDTRGRIHMPKQDLSKLQTRKMKGLKKPRISDDDGEEEEDEEEDSAEE